MDIFVVDLPHTPTDAPTRDFAGSTLTDIKLVVPEVTGVSTGGLPILSYKTESS